MKAKSIAICMMFAVLSQPAFAADHDEREINQKPLSGVGQPLEAKPDGSRSDGRPYFTGSLYSSSASTLPKGRLIVAPLLYEVHGIGSFGSNGKFVRSNGSADDVRYLTQILYGASDKVTVGIIPRLGWNSSYGGKKSSNLELGDTSVRLKVRVGRFSTPSHRIDASLSVDETFPTGLYDNLKSSRRSGLGSGAYAATFAALAQYTAWPVNGRAFRVRLNASYTLPSQAHVENLSVYGTPNAFDGHVRPGDGEAIGLSFEYSLNRNVALCSEFLFNHQNVTVVKGIAGGSYYSKNIPPSTRLDVAPAVEYSFSGNLGVIFGVRVPVAGRDSRASVSPTIGIDAIF